jgi:hypothetical protein
MGSTPEDQISPLGDYPTREVPLHFEGGPFDGEATLSLSAPLPLSIRVIEVPDHPEGFYQMSSDGRFHWTKGE